MRNLPEEAFEGFTEKYTPISEDKLELAFALSSITSTPPSITTDIPIKTISANHELSINNKVQNNPTNFDDAIGKTNIGIFNYFIIFLSGTILTAVLTETLSISFILPVSQCDLKLTTPEKGALGAIGFLGIISSSHLWGFLADTVGRRKVLLPSLFIAFLCSASSSLANNFSTLVTLRFLNGFFISCSSSTIFAYLGEFHNTKNRARMIMFASVIYGLTCILEPIVAYFVINQNWEFFIPILNVTYRPWRSFIVVSSIPSLASAIAFLFLPESPKFMLSKGHEKEAIRIIKLVHRINNGRKAKPLELESLVDDMDAHFNKEMEKHSTRTTKSKDPLSIVKLMWNQTLPLFQRKFIKSTLTVCCAQFLIFVTSNGLYLWVPEILNRIAQFMKANPNEYVSVCEIMARTTVNISAIILSDGDRTDCVDHIESETMTYTIILEIAYAVGFFLMGILINPIGKLPLLTFITIGSGLAGILLSFLQHPLIGIYLTLILITCGLSCMIVNAATVELFPTNIKAMAVCISLMIGRLGGVVGANMAGLLLDYQCEYLFTISGLCLIGCGILAFFIPNIREKHKVIASDNNNAINNNGVEININKPQKY